MRRYLFALLCTLSLQPLCAQTLTAEPLSVSGTDLSARTYPVLDTNGLRCALVKINCLDEVTKVQGNVVAEKDNGNEHWLYLSTGTKRIRILTAHHHPLDVSLVDAENQGVQTAMTYTLTLNSDLPPELLFGTGSKALAPTSMRSESDPQLPPWFDTQSPDLYMGVSIPSFDARYAKEQALINAAMQYALQGYSTVNYTGVLYEEDTEAYQTVAHKWECRQHYALVSSDFEFDIYQEYYNSRGEYFVLCRITPSAGSENKLCVDWNYCSNGEEKYGSIMANTSLSTRNADGKINITSVYEALWQNGNELSLNDKVHLDETVEGDKDWSYMVNLTSAQVLGMTQKRLLYALTCVPDTVQINVNMESSKDYFKRIATVTGMGLMSPRSIHLSLGADGVVAFSIEEKFPMSVIDDDSGIEVWMQITGLGQNYFRRGYHEAQGFAHQAMLLEPGKNDAFLLALAADGGRNHGDKMRIYPLWLLDAKERFNGKVSKKYKKARLEYYPNIPRMVKVLLP